MHRQSHLEVSSSIDVFLSDLQSIVKGLASTLLLESFIIVACLSTMTIADSSASSARHSAFESMTLITEHKYIYDDVTKITNDLNI